MTDETAEIIEHSVPWLMNSFTAFQHWRQKGYSVTSATNLAHSEHCPIPIVRDKARAYCETFTNERPWEK